MSSGTVGAALEGCVHGRRAIAMSFPFKGWGSWTDEDVTCALEVALDVTGSLWRSWSEEDGLRLLQGDAANRASASAGRSGKQQPYEVPGVLVGGIVLKKNRW